MAYITRSRILTTLVAGIIALTAVLPAAQVSQAAEGRASSGLSRSVVGEGTDFATTVLGQPWDMTAGPYPDYRTVFSNFNQAGFQANGGVWTLQPSAGDASINIHYRGENLTQRVLKLGDVYPIDPARFFILTLRMNSPRETAARLYWFMDPWTTGAGLGTYTCSVPIQVKAGWQTYTVDLRALKTDGGCPGGLGWSSLNRGVQGLTIYPSYDAKSTDRFQVDWIRLTGLDTAENQRVGIPWSGVSGSKVEFFADSDCVFDGASIKLGEVSNPGSSGTFNWGERLISNPNLSQSSYPLPSSLQPGTYQIFFRAGSKDTCAGPLEIRRAPVLTWQQPSMTSGPDYAAEQAGDAWGMNNANDIDLSSSLSGINFNNDMLNATAFGDNWIHLNVPKAIDAERYYYVTFRLKVDTYIDHMVQRFIWWQTRPEEARITQDLRLREGWHTYSFDLRKAPMEVGGGWSGDPIVFRLDFHEDPVNQIPVHLDYVTLTGDHYIKRGNSFSLYYDLAAASGTRVTFHLDTDRSAGNGVGGSIGTAGDEQPAEAMPAVEEQAAARKIFMPLMARLFPTEINLLTGNRWDFNTANVSPGTYYLAAVVNDGYNTVTWHAEVPVIITP